MKCIKCKQPVTHIVDNDLVCNVCRAKHEQFMNAIFNIHQQIKVRPVQTRFVWFYLKWKLFAFIDEGLLDYVFKSEHSMLYGEFIRFIEVNYFKVAKYTGELDLKQTHPITYEEVRREIMYRFFYKGER